jgi:hypothetical protein
MTYTRPLRRTILQPSQIRLTLARIFIVQPYRKNRDQLKLAVRRDFGRERTPDYKEIVYQSASQSPILPEKFRRFSPTA